MRTCVTLTALLASLPAAAAQADPLDGGTATRAVDGGYQETPEQIAHDAALRAEILQEVQQQEDAKLAKMREELRDEMRAEMTTAGATPRSGMTARRAVWQRAALQMKRIPLDPARDRQ